MSNSVESYIERLNRKVSELQQDLVTIQASVDLKQKAFIIESIKNELQRLYAEQDDVTYQP